MKNRIQIVNWRCLGDDESFCETQAYTADDPTDLSVEASQDIPPDRFFVNDDITFYDGQEFFCPDGTILVLRLEKQAKQEQTNGRV